MVRPRREPTRRLRAPASHRLERADSHVGWWTSRPIRHTLAFSGFAFAGPQARPRAPCSLAACARRQPRSRWPLIRRAARTAARERAPRPILEAPLEHSPRPIIRQRLPKSSFASQGAAASGSKHGSDFSDEIRKNLLVAAEPGVDSRGGPERKAWGDDLRTSGGAGRGLDKAGRIGRRSNNRGREHIRKSGDLGF